MVLLDYMVDLIVALQYRWSYYYIDGHNIDGRITIQMVVLQYRWSHYNIDGHH